MKKIRIFAAALSMTWLTAFAFNPEVDLKDAQAVAQGQCKYQNEVYVCFILQKDNSFYMVAVDREGPLAVYSVTGLKQTYSPGEVTLIWERIPDRRQNGSST